MSRLIPLARPLKVFPEDAQREVDNLHSGLRRLQDVPLLDGNFVEDVALSTTAKAIKHGLGRRPRGYQVVDQNADARVWRSAASTTTELTLRASAAVTVNLWVF